jgi:hypothetical protein
VRVIIYNKHKQHEVCAVKRLFWVVLAVFVSGIFAVPQQVWAAASTGAGTVGDPYQISTCAGLQAINSNLTAHYKLVDYIDCTGFGGTDGFMPIADYNNSQFFTGTLDGNGFTISNLSINRPAMDYVGIFSAATSGSFTDIVIYQMQIVGHNYVGGLLGYGNGVVLRNVEISDATLTGSRSIAAVASVLNNSTATDIQVIDVSASGYDELGTVNEVAGFAASVTSSEIARVKVTGSVVGNAASGNSNKIAGFAAYVDDTHIDDSYTNVHVVGGSAASGFVGQSTDSIITRVYARGLVEGSFYGGGLIGRMYGGTLQHSFSVAEVQVGAYFGSVVGETIDIYPGTLTNVYYDQSTSGGAPCVGIDEISAVCTAIDGGTDPGYFKGSSASAPLDTWNFTSKIWRTATDDYPELRWVPDRSDNVRVALDSTSITVSWETPGGVQYNPVVGYELLYYVDSAVINPAMLPASQHSFAITGLQPDTQYIINLRAINAIGNGTWASFVTFTTKLAVSEIVTGNNVVTAAKKSNKSSATATTTEDSNVVAEESESSAAVIPAQLPSPTATPQPLLLDQPATDMPTSGILGYTLISVVGLGILWFVYTFLKK